MKRFKSWLCQKITGMPLRDVHRLQIFSAKSVYEADFNKDQTFSHNVIRDVIDRNLPALATMYFKKKAVIYSPIDPSHGDADIRTHFDAYTVN